MTERPHKHSPHPPRLAVLLSGSGRTLLNILDRIDTGHLDAQVALVIGSRECLGIERARNRQIPSEIRPGPIPDTELQLRLLERRISLVVLAGYLQLVHVPSLYHGRVVNIHPALLPKFGGKGMYGHHVHKAVLDAGESESGCTVHLVDERYDTGPIVAQRTCPVMPDDTPDTLASRVFEHECEAYPHAIRQLLATHPAPPDV